MLQRMSRWSERMSRWSERMSRWSERMSRWSERMSRWSERMSRWWKRLSRRPRMLQYHYDPMILRIDDTETGGGEEGFHLENESEK